MSLVNCVVAYTSVPESFVLVCHRGRSNGSVFLKKPRGGFVLEKGLSLTSTSLFDDRTAIFVLYDTWLWING